MHKLTHHAWCVTVPRAQASKTFTDIFILYSGNKILTLKHIETRVLTASSRSRTKSQSRQNESETGPLHARFVIIDRFLYSAILCWQADSLRSYVILHEWIAFYSAFLNIHWSGVLTALTWLVPQESAARESVSVRSVYTIQPCTVSLHAKPHT